ncbi:hypothetical protein LLG96_09455 [bacterium]|nr:hypothetical protein [bacterium]
MKFGILVMLCVLSLTGLAWCDVPEYTVLRTTGKIVLDGILDEEDWTVAPAVDAFVFPWWTEGDKEQTSVKLLWNDTYLYIAITCQDKHIWADHYDTNSWTYIDDAAEFFWNPNPGAGDIYYFFEMNCIGNLLCVYDYYSDDFLINKAMVPRIATTVRGTVNKDTDFDSGWTLEIAIRFSDYPELSMREKPLPGDVWRANFNRCGGKTNYQYSQWSPSQTDKPNFHRPEDFGRLVFSDRPVTAPSEVRENAGDFVPAGIAIHGNYPNPFNPSTMIEYSLSRSGFTDLVIYNAANQKVKTLVSEYKTAGSYSVFWDGTDDHGAKAASGVYISRLKMDGLMAAGRMTLVK